MLLPGNPIWLSPGAVIYCATDFATQNANTRGIPGGGQYTYFVFALSLELERNEYTVTETHPKLQITVPGIQSDSISSRSTRTDSASRRCQQRRFQQSITQVVFEHALEVGQGLPAVLAFGGRLELAATAGIDGAVQLLPKLAEFLPVGALHPV